MTQPSGWYDDPQDPDYLRYFDGVEWTEHRAPKRAPQLDRPATPVAGDPAGPYAARPDDRAPGRPGGEAWQQAGWQQGGWQQAAPGPAGAATTPDGMPLAGWGRRVVAWVLDYLLATLLTMPIVYPFVRTWVDEVSTWTDRVVQSGSSDPATWPTMPQPDPVMVAQVSLVSLVVYLVYELLCLSRWGRTPGRAALGISVRAVESPEPAPTSRLLVRTLVKRADVIVPLAGLGSLFMVIDGLFPLWDRPLRQAIHDKAGRTCVVRGRLPRRG